MDQAGSFFVVGYRTNLICDLVGTHKALRLDFEDEDGAGVFFLIDG